MEMGADTRTHIKQSPPCPKHTGICARDESGDSGLIVAKENWVSAAHAVSGKGKKRLGFSVRD